MMRRLASALITLFLPLALSAQITFGEKTSINEGWSFSLDGGTVIRVDLPHDWSIMQDPSPSQSSCTGYLPGGIGVYERDLTIPSSQKGRRQYLYFEGVYCCSEVKVNGHLCGYRPNGYVSFCYDITPFVKFGEKNRISVRVDHSKSADSRYYTGSGIYRDVYLVSCDPVHIGCWGVFVTTPEVKAGKATVNVRTTVVNDSRKTARIEIRQRLFQKDNYEVLASSRKSLSLKAGTQQTVSQDVFLESPKLWSIENPNLYRVETAIYRDGERIDGCSTTTGIRTIRYDADEGFFLNGKNTKIKGVCLHHDAGSLGAIVPKSILRDRLGLLKELGCNAIRMSHNPQAEMMYDLCDELGFLVMDEAFDEWMSPKRKWVEGWNVGKHPSLDGYAEFFEDWADRDVADMVLRDRNHPSIIMWSIGNEIDYPNDPYTHPVLDYEGINQRTTPGFKPERERAEVLGPVAIRLAGIIHDIDTTRAVTAALAGVVMSNYTDYPGALDIVGYNYTEFRYGRDHQKYPGRVLYGSENRHDYPSWKAVTDNGFILGQFLWTGFDYLGEARVWPSRGSSAGLLDYCGHIKPRGYYRQTLWSDKPCIAVGTKAASQVGDNASSQDWPALWNYAEGEEVCIAVMSNCTDLSLYVNGTRVEGEPLYLEASNAWCWTVPFTAGQVRCTGTKDGKKAETVIRTYSEPTGFLTSVSRHRLMGKGDVVAVDINIIDRDGNIVADATQTVSCEVSGAAELVAMENGNPRYECSYHGSSIPAFAGRAIAYIRSTAERGEAMVTISCMGKESGISLTVNELREPYILDTLTAKAEVYRHDPDMKIYFMYPNRPLSKKEQLPTMVFYFGGGWVSGSVEAFAGQGKELTEHGMAVALVDYRVWKRNGTKPQDCIEDAKSAMRYIRANAERLHVDPDRICTSGGSAGGHLASAVAFCPGFDAPGDDVSISTVPNAMVLYNPVFNNAPEPEGYGYSRIEKDFPAFSPYHNIKAPAPPTLVMLGSKDHLIPSSTAIAFEKKMKEAGARCETIIFEGAGHGFFNWSNWVKSRSKDPDAPCYYRLTLDRHIEFLQSLGWIE